MNEFKNLLMVLGLLSFLALVFHAIPLAFAGLLVLIRDWWTGYKRPLLDEEVHERMVKEFTEAALALMAMSPPPENPPAFAEKVYRDLIEKYSKELSRLIPGWWD